MEYGYIDGYWSFLYNRSIINEHSNRSVVSLLIFTLNSRYSTSSEQAGQVLWGNTHGLPTD